MPKCWLCIGLICVWAAGSASEGYAQSLRFSQNQDSLRQVIQQAQAAGNDTLAVYVGHLLVQQVWNQQLDSAYGLALQNLAKARKANYWRGVAQAYNDVAYIHQRKGNHEEGVSWGLKALEVVKKYPDNYLLGWVYHTLGNNYNYLGLYDLSLNYHLKAAEVREKTRDYFGLGYTYSNIGLVYERQGNNAESIRFREKALAIFSANGEYEAVVGGFAQLAILYQRTGQLDKALAAADSSLRLIERYKLKDHTRFNTYRALAEIYHARMDLPNTRKYYRLMAESAEQNPIAFQRIALSYNLYSDICLQQNDLPEAARYAEKTLNLLRNRNLPLELSEAKRILATVRERQGRYAEAVQLLREAQIIADTLNRRTSERMAQSVGQQLAAQKRELIIEQQQRSLEQSQFVRNLFVVIGFVSVVAVAILIESMRSQRKLNRRLAARKQELDEQNEDLAQKNEELRATLEQLKETQDELSRSERLALLGRLVANISHEVNTPLGSLRSNLQVMQTGLGTLAQQLPELVASFTPVEQRLFFRLLQAGNPDEFRQLSTREERQLRRMLELQLQQAGALQPDKLTQLLLRCGITSLAPVRHALKEPRLPEILQAVALLQDLQANLKDSHRSADRIRRVVYGLKGFMDELELQKGFAQAQRVAEKVIQGLGSYLKGGIILEKKYESDPTLALAEDDLEQILSTLLYHFVVRLEGMGKLCISMWEEGQVGVLTLQIFGSRGGNLQAHGLFEPLQATSAAGEGSGVGLYSVRRVVEAAGGSIAASETDEMLTVRLVLPLAFEWQHQAEGGKG